MTIFRIEGYNQVRLLNELRGEGVLLARIERTNKQSMLISAPQKHSAKIVAICAQMCYNISVVREGGSRAALRLAAKRAGLIAGTLVFVTALIVSQLFVWRIEITGGDVADSKRVAALLKDNGVGRLSLRRRVDVDKITQAIQSEDFAVAASVEIVGTTLVIDIVPALDYIPPDYAEPRDITSRYDALITRVVARSGTPAVRVGDVVSSGDKLIGAYSVNSGGEQLFVTRADGEVYGKIYRAVSRSFGLTETSVRRTGNSVTYTQITLFGFSIFDNNRRPSFESYQYVRSQTHLSRGNLLPVMYVTHTYYETVTETVTYNSAEERVQSFIQEAKSALILDGDYEILGVRHTLRQAGEIYFLSIFIEIEALLNAN